MKSSSPGGGRRPVVQGQRTLDGEVRQPQGKRRDGARGDDSRQGANLPKGLAVEVHSGSRRGPRVQEDLQCHRVSRRKAQVYAHEPREALDEQTRTAQQHQRQSDLRRHQHAACSLRHAEADAATAAEQVRGIASKHLPRRREPEQQGGRDHQPDGEAQQPPIQGDPLEPRHIGRQQRRNRFDRCGRQHESAEASQYGDDHALGQQLAQQPRRAAAHRRPDGELLLALRRSRQHQVRDVDAGDQQHEDHGAPEQQQYRAHRFDAPHLQRNDARANTRIRAWMVDHQARRDGVHLRLRLRERNLRPDPRDHVPPAAAADVGLVLGDRLGQVEVAIAAAPFETELEIRRQHAHHRIRSPVERQRAAEDAGVAAEAALPEPVGDYHDAAAGAELLRKERPAVRGAGAERLEEAFRDERPVEHLGLSIAGEVERIGLDGRHVLEAPGLRAPVEKGRRGHRDGLAAVLRIGLPQRHQAVRFRKRRRLDQHGVDQREDRGRSPDRERQRQDRGRGEPGAAPQQAQSVAEVTERFSESRAEPDAANVLPGRCHASEGRQRLTARFRARNPPRAALLDLQGDVMLQLLVQLAVRAIPVEQRPQPDPPRVQPSLQQHVSGLGQAHDVGNGL